MPLLHPRPIVGPTGPRVGPTGQCITHILQPVLILRYFSLFCSQGYMLVFPLLQGFRRSGSQMPNSMLSLARQSNRTVAAGRALLAGERRGAGGYPAVAGPAGGAPLGPFGPPRAARPIPD